MLDIKWIRENKEEFDKLLVKRNSKPIAEIVITLDEENRQLKTLIQELRESKNKKTSCLESMKDKNSIEFQKIKTDVLNIKKELEDLENKLSDDKQLQVILDNLPNIPAFDVPEGIDEKDNKLVKKWGEINQNLIKPHYELGENLKMMDFTQTAKISGSRFVSLSRDLAKLERALVNFMIDIHTKEFDFVEVSPPILVKPSAMYNVGQLPKFAEESYVTTDDYRLIPTAEVSLTNMVSDTIIDRIELPIRYVAHTPCFRSEAGSAGKDTRGMIRLHQFYKVELVTISTPDESEREHQYMLNAAEEILKRLNLPYRVMLLCAGDMGFAAKKTYDIEVWLPAQNTYREISSCSNCGDFQARRMKARYKEFNSHDNIFVHTLNGSALPIGRTMVAILENYQNEDGSISIPDALIAYMDGQKKIIPYKAEYT